MAVVVPFVMAAAGASATTIALTSVAFAVTGISAKINKAAASVFGEDLVKIGNLFGAAYSMYNGGFDIGGGAEAASTASSTSDVFSAGSITEGASNAVSEIGNTSYNLADAAGSVDSFSGQLGAGSTSSIGGSLSLGSGSIDLLGAGAAPAAEAGSQYSLASMRDSFAPAADVGRSVSASGAAGAGAANAGATESIMPSYDQMYGSGSASGAAATNQVAAAPQRSIFDRIVMDDKGSVKPAALQLGGSLIQGLGSGYANAQAAKQRQAELDEQRRRMGISTGLRVTN